MKNIFRLSLLFFALVFLQGCSKTKFLDAKSNEALVIPVSLEDMQAILDNNEQMNGQEHGTGLVPQLGETGADNYFLKDESYNNIIQPKERDCYVWKAEPSEATAVYDWNLPYRCVFNSNVVLEGLEKISVDSEKKNSYDNIKGSALFYRAHAFYQLAQVFAPHYYASTAPEDLGIPLRKGADISEKLNRATVQQTYDQIINDLIEARQLLPEYPALLYKTRPSRIAVYALLARIYQTMQIYEKALIYSDSALLIQSSLMDFNSLDKTAEYPFSININPEVIFHCAMVGWGTSQNYPFFPYIGDVDSSLYKSYDINDLRKDLYFKDLYGVFSFNGSYNSASGGLIFAGLATDEMYLIRAESNARMQNISAAMEDLNTLLKNRWKTGTFIPFEAQDANEALMLVLTERRKELCFRGLRWTDLRRLNKEGANLTLTRKINGENYTLPPNDLRYTWLIPKSIIQLNPEMQQNPR